MIKDDEIDLTDHRDFRGERPTPLFIRREDGNIYSNIHTFIKDVFNKQVYGNFPWEVIPLHLKGYYKYDGLFALGNKERRKEVIESYYWGSSENKFCDCCGGEYKKIPWNYDFGLCNICRNYDRPRNIPWSGRGI